MGAALPSVLADLSTLGGSLGFGVAIGLGAFGVAVGVGLIFAAMIQSTSRQHEVKSGLPLLMWLGFALTEAVIFYSLVGAMLMLILV